MKVLLVEDELNIRNSLIKYFGMHDISTLPAENGHSALRICEETIIDVIVSDLKMPGMDGLQLLETLRKNGNETPFILISAHGEIMDAVTALKAGAYDFIEKPFAPESLENKIRNAFEEYRLRKIVRAAATDSNKLDELVGLSPVVLDIKKKIQKIAPVGSTVLITGESGTGKEVIARCIHKLSAVSNGPFLAVHLAGLPESLIESELFGHEKGAFTGAERQKKGVFELAAGGTLMLDEIGEISMSIQVKLLRVLQEQKIMRIGGETEIPVNARVIAATNRNMEAAVTAGNFREDLYYRLNVVRLHVPPLKERKEDIPLLAASILQKLNKKMGKQIESISSEALAVLSEYSYRGNIRELENMIERACIYADSEITVKDFDQYFPVNVRKDTTAPAPGSLRDMEKRMIEEALLRWESNRTKAAIELGISRQNLIKKIEEYGLKTKEED